MQHFTDDVWISEPTPGQYQITFKAVAYLPTSSPSAAGTLLFGLRPRGLQLDCKRDPGMFLYLAQHCAHTLHWHANGSKKKLDGTRRVSLEKLTEWVADAVALAPDAATAAEALRLINENLGPYAYDE